MTRTTKSFIAIIIFALVAAVAELLLLRYAEKQSFTQGTQTNVAEEKQTYRNEVFGFSLALPEYYTPKDGNEFGYQWVSFHRTTTMPEWISQVGITASAFDIHMYKNEDYAEDQRECRARKVEDLAPDCHHALEQGTYKVVGKNNLYTFVYSGPGDYPTDFTPEYFADGLRVAQSLQAFDVSLPPVSSARGKIVSGWKLVSGDPHDTCTAPSFVGEALVYGWYVYDYDYAGKSWQLRIADADLDKLPVDKLFNGDTSLLSNYKRYPVFRAYRNFDAESTDKLVPISTALENSLKQASSQNPYPVTVTWFSQYCEGSGILEIKE